MQRRRFIAALACAFGARSLHVRAQQATRVWRIGYLDQGPIEHNQHYVDALQQGLVELGWTSERIQIEPRFAEGKTDRLPMLATDLVREKMDIIATWSTPAALAAKEATKTIPIVIGFTADPVGSSIVASLAHPGGNVTGWTHLGLELRAKYLELLKEAVPGGKRFGVLWNPTNQVHRPSLKTVEMAARQRKVDIHPIGVRDPKDIEAAYSAMIDQGVHALIVFPDGMFVAQTPVFISLGARYRLPTIYGIRDYVEAGGLMAYGADLIAMQHQVGASFVDKILRGAKPGDLPVAQPTKFELLINMNTARALGLALPQSLLLRADQLVQS